MEGEIEWRGVREWGCPGSEGRTGPGMALVGLRVDEIENVPKRS